MTFPSFIVVCIAVASLAAVIALAAALGLDFLGDFFEGLLLIKDFFVTAMVVSPGFGFELLYACLCCTLRAKPQSPLQNS